MSRNRHDPGLRAVARVRSIRERDSLLGLRTSLLEQRETEQVVTDLEHRLDSSFAPDGTPAAFLAARAVGHALAVEADRARAAATTARTFTIASREHWQRDRSRLSAVELLLERRAVERRREADQQEAREADELAAVRWLRAQRASLAPAEGEGR